MDEFVLPEIASEQCSEFMDIDPDIMYVIVIEISIIKLRLNHKINLMLRRYNNKQYHW